MGSSIQTDLTEGSVSKQLIRYAIPMVTTSLLQAIYSIVDIIIAGHFIGNNGISAINNSSLVMNLLAQIAIGITVGGNVLIGQYFGKKDPDNVKKASGSLFSLCIVLSIAVGIVFFVIARPLMGALGSPALEDAITYLRTCSVGMLFIFGYNALSAILRGLGNSKKPMHFILCGTIANVVLDLLFVAGLDMGVFGAALATVIAQGVTFGLALMFVVRRKAETGFVKEYLKIRADKVRMIFKLGFPIAMQWGVASISWLVVMVLINKYGMDVSAGNGVSNKIKDFCQLFISAVTSGAATMAAQNMGAQRFDRAEEVMRTCMKITLGIAVAAIVICEIFAPYLVGIFTSDPAAIQPAIHNLRIEIIAQMFYAGFMTYNVLATAAGDTMFVMWNSFLNCIVVRLVLAIILEHLLGVWGIYIACAIAPFSSVPVGAWYYRSKRWRKSFLAKKEAQASS